MCGPRDVGDGSSETRLGTASNAKTAARRAEDGAASPCASTKLDLGVRVQLALAFVTTAPEREGAPPSQSCGSIR